MNTTTTAPKSDVPTANANKMRKVDVHNPTKATRIIHDGNQAAAQRAYGIHSGETKHGLLLHEDIIKELRARVRPRGKENSDLHVYNPGEAPPVPSAATATSDDPDADDGK